jgi:ABC-type branched-subunit amino acid transport system substrate-binding protein
MAKRSRLFAMIAAGSLVLAACSSSSSSKSATATTGGSSGASSGGGSTKYPPIPAGPIVLGVSLPLSGATAAYGLTAQVSFNKVTIPEFNAQNPNGIDGHPVQIKILDDASDVTKAVSAATQFVADHVAAVLTASYNPEAAGQQYAVWNKAKVPVVSVLSGSQYANASAWPYFFGTGPSVQQEGTATAQWIGKKGFTRVATLNDGLPQDTDALSQITNALKTEAPQASVVKSVTIPPGSVDASAAVAQLKAANPDVLIVYIGFGYGPVWSAIRASGWSPQIIASAGAWYDGFTAMGPLAAKAVSPYNDCADSSSQTWPTDGAGLMSKYSAATAGGFVNYLTFVQTDTVALEILKYAIEKYHSVDPNAIKAAIDGMHGMSFHGINYDYSPTNHYGISGPFAAAVCNMGPPFAGGDAKVPVKA